MRPRRMGGGTTRFTHHLPANGLARAGYACTSPKTTFKHPRPIEMPDRNRARLSKLSLALIAALAAAPALAQTTSAGLGGRVVGADGQPVARDELTSVHAES